MVIKLRMIRHVDNNESVDKEYNIIGNLRYSLIFI